MADSAQVQDRLSTELVAFLQGPQPVLITTLDAETKWPTNNLITWVYAKDPTTVRLVTDSKGRVMANIRSDERVLLTIMADGGCYTIEGTGSVIADEIPGVTLKLGCAEVKVLVVRDVTFYGGRLTTQPAFDVTYDRALKAKLDTGVFAAMQNL